MTAYVRVEGDKKGGEGGGGGGGGGNERERKGLPGSGNEKGKEENARTRREGRGGGGGSEGGKANERRGSVGDKSRSNGLLPSNGMLPGYQVLKRTCQVTMRKIMYLRLR